MVNLSNFVKHHRQFLGMTPKQYLEHLKVYADVSYVEDIENGKDTPEWFTKALLDYMDINNIKKLPEEDTVNIIFPISRSSLSLIQKQIDAILQRDRISQAAAVIPAFVMGRKNAVKIDPIMCKKVASIRKEKGLTQQDFAKLIGVSYTLINGIENEFRPVSERTRILIEKNLHIKL